MKFRWSLASPQPGLAEKIATSQGIPPLLAQCLINRGLTEPPAIAAFLRPRLKQLADPFLLPNMAPAVERLLQARARDEPLVIFGDYDVDGVTSTALLLEVLRPLGWKVHYYLPRRMDEGYGLATMEWKTASPSSPSPCCSPWTAAQPPPPPSPHSKSVAWM